MSEEKNDSRQWFLRTGDKTIFGPVPTSNFITWAEQGRILSGHEVSCDRKNWVPAEQVPELGITWYVDDGTGKLRGPLNRVAAEQVLKSDKAPAGAKLVKAADADPAHVIRADDKVADNVAAVAPRKETQAVKSSETADVSNRGKEEQDSKTIQKLKQTIEKLEKELADARDLPLLNRPPESADADLTKAHKEVAEYKAKLKESSAQFKQQQAELAKVQKEAAEANKILQDRNTEISKLKEGEAELLAFANSRDTEMTQRIVELEQRLEAANAEIARPKVPEINEYIRSVLNNELQALDADLQREKETFNTLRELSQKRQDNIQNRIRELTRQLQNGDSNKNIRISGSGMQSAEINILRAELSAVRSMHEAETKQSSEREVELVAKLRDISMEQKQRSIEKEQLLANEQTLLRRIEELEQRLNHQATVPVAIEEKNQEPEQPKQPPEQPKSPKQPPPEKPNSGFFRATPWMRLEK
jgi:hypothetical protein